MAIRLPALADDPSGRKDGELTISNKIYDYSIELILICIKPRISYYGYINSKRIKGMDYDDICQELSIKVWILYKNRKIPADMKLDRRFTLWLDRVFYNHINELFYKQVSRRKLQRGLFQYRDRLNECSQLKDIEKF